MDKLTVKGVGKRVDGTYECDIQAMLIDVSSSEALTGDEAATIKKACGAYGYDIARQFLDDDWTVQLAVALVVLARHDVTLDERQARAQRVGAFRFELAPAETEDDAADPPGEGSTPSSNGGESGPPTSDANPESPPVSTGRLASVGS